MSSSTRESHLLSLQNLLFPLLNFVLPDLIIMYQPLFHAFLISTVLSFILLPLSSAVKPHTNAEINTYLVFEEH